MLQFPGIPPQPSATRVISQWTRSLEWCHAVTLHILVGKICISFFLFYCEGMLPLVVLWHCNSNTSYEWRGSSTAVVSGPLITASVSGPLITTSVSGHVIAPFRVAMCPIPVGRCARNMCSLIVILQLESLSSNRFWLLAMLQSIPKLCSYLLK